MDDGQSSLKIDSEDDEDDEESSEEEDEESSEEEDEESCEEEVEESCEEEVEEVEEVSDEDEEEINEKRKKDLLIGHLLRITCNSKELLRKALVELTSELLVFGLVSKDVLDFSSQSSRDFYAIFMDNHKANLNSTYFPEFWKPMETKYEIDFTEIRPLGLGGFGRVMRCENKLDKREYAVKIIPLQNEEKPTSKETIGSDEARREARTHAMMQHENVVRYYHSWIEGGVPYSAENLGSGSSSGLGSQSVSQEILKQGDHMHCLYIQMELCVRTLSKHLEQYVFNEEFASRVSRQIVTGLSHIHQKGVVHRDLAPKNIFFDSLNEIKIGDFGLAKVLDLGEDDESWTVNSGKDGTELYKAPEILPNAKISKKVDIYSFGMIFFELWHPFKTGWERHIVLQKLKNDGIMPDEFTSAYPNHARLLRKLLARDPLDRPSIIEILEDDLFSEVGA